MGAGQPPDSQIDTLGKLGEKWVLQGLGEAIPVEAHFERRGSSPTIWQWFRLKFGQTVLVKRRTEVKTLTEDVLPVEPRAAEPDGQAPLQGRTKAERSAQNLPVEQAALWDRPENIKVPVQRRITIEIATDQAISSGFRNDIVGLLLIQLAEQEDGINKSIAFAAIVAKARQARMKREKKPNS